MNPLPANPSKTQEIDHLNEFINRLPRGCYLQMFFDASAAALIEAIRNDGPIDPLEGLWKRQREELDELAKLRADNNRLTDDLMSLGQMISAKQRELARVQAAIDKLRDEARRLAEA